MSAERAKRKAEDHAPMQVWAVLCESKVLSTFTAHEPAVSYASIAPSGQTWRVVEFIEVRQPPPRDTEWGDGQLDYVTLGPGVQASLRITKDGRVKLTIPGGELDVTDGGTTLGSGLHEAGARAAQIRVRRENRAADRKTAKRRDAGKEPT